METSSRQYLSRCTSFVRGGPSFLDRRFHSLGRASRCSAYAAVSRVVRLSQYTCLASCRQAPVRSLLVVERQVPPQSLAGGADAVVGLQIHRLVP